MLESTSRTIAYITNNRAQIVRYRKRQEPPKGHYALGRGMLTTEKRAMRALAALMLPEEELEGAGGKTAAAMELTLRLRQVERTKFVEWTKEMSDELKATAKRERDEAAEQLASLRAAAAARVRREAPIDLDGAGAAGAGAPLDYGEGDGLMDAE